MNEKKVSRRDFLRLGTLAAASGALAACAPSTPEVIREQVEVTRIVEKEGETVVETVIEEVMVTAVPAPEEMVEITFMGWGGTEEDEGVRAAIRVFEGAEPNIKVTWLHTPDAYSEKMLAMVAAGTPPDTAFIRNQDYIRKSSAAHTKGAGTASVAAGRGVISTSTRISLTRRASSRPATTPMRPGIGTISSRWPASSRWMSTATTPGIAASIRTTQNDGASTGRNGGCIT
jgi:hypothetical protein